MTDRLSLDQLRDLRGSTVYAQGGDKIGSVEEIFYDADTNAPEWVGIGTGLFGTKRVLVPIVGGSTTADGVTVPYTKDHVKDSPDIDGDEISEHLERQLYSYYCLPASDARSDTTYADTSGTTDVDTTRTPGVETRRTRLRKYVDTEPVQAEVTLEQERARVVREPINEPVSASDIGEDTIDVTLEGEQAVVDKRVVAKERIGVDVDRTAETPSISTRSLQTWSETVRTRTWMT